MSKSVLRKIGGYAFAVAFIAAGWWITAVLVSSDNWEELEYQAQRNGIAGFFPVPFFKGSLIGGLIRAAGTGTQDSTPGGLPDLSGKRLLLVEDNLINREIAREILAATGAEILTAEDGQQALDAYLASEEGFIRLVLMDVQMPVMDGYTATRKIRDSGRKDADLPIYAMTANTFAEDMAKARRAGMNGHIAKPIDMNALMQTLRRALP